MVPKAPLVPGVGALRAKHPLFPGTGASNLLYRLPGGIGVFSLLLLSVLLFLLGLLGCSGGGL